MSDEQKTNGAEQAAEAKDPIQALRANYATQFEAAAKELQELSSKAEQVKVMLEQLRGAIFALDQASKTSTAASAEAPAAPAAAEAKA
jgi:hypothetical protein